MSGRNFGIPKVTSPAAGGGTQLPGSHSPHDTQRGNVIQLAGYASSRRGQPNSRASLPELFIQSDETSIHPFELGSHALFLILLFAPPVIVGGIVLGYLAFGSQPVQY